MSGAVDHHSPCVSFYQQDDPLRGKELNPRVKKFAAILFIVYIIIGKKLYTMILTEVMNHRGKETI